MSESILYSLLRRRHELFKVQGCGWSSSWSSSSSSSSSTAFMASFWCPDDDDDGDGGGVGAGGEFDGPG